MHSHFPQSDASGRNATSANLLRAAPSSLSIINYPLSIVHLRHFLRGVACCTLFQLLLLQCVLKAKNAAIPMLLQA
jgi:hypothetical protein